MEALGPIILYSCLFLLLVSGVMHLSRRGSVPASAWMLLLGLAYGLARRQGLDGLPQFVLSPEIVIMLFLPVLIFGASRKLPARSVLAELPAIAYLSLLGPLISMALLALPLVWIGGWTWPPALLFGAALSATDPLAIGALLQNVGLPRQLSIWIEGESLFNDAVAVILFSLLAGTVSGAPHLSISGTVGGFVYSLAGAVGVGTLAGALAGGLLRFWHDIHDRFIGALLPLVLVYGVFVVAHSILHVSGVVAVVTATLTLSLFHSHHHRSTDTHARADHFFDDFWGFIDTLANATLFFGLGAMVGEHHWLLPWILVPAICIALLLSRLATVYPMGLLARMAGRRIPLTWQHMLSAAGLRGGLSVALLLSLPASFEHRTAMVCLAFALLLFSLAAYLLTASLYLRKIDFAETDQDRESIQTRDPI